MARRLNQVSKFGAWFDLFIDNLSRTLLWTNISSVRFFIFLSLNNLKENKKNEFLFYLKNNYFS